MRKRLSRLIGRVAVVLVIAAGSVTGAQPAHAETVIAPQDGYGFSVGAPMTWMSAADADRELDAAASTGATWLRVMIDWHVVEPKPGEFNWGYVDHWINGSLNRGLKVLGLIAYTPDWARPAGSFFTAPPVDPAKFADFATKVVQRYGDRVSHWEIWNEPNVPLFWGYMDDRAPSYTRVLKAAYPAIKAVQPNSTVVAAGLSRAPDPNAPPPFVATMYALGAKGFFDALAMHPYVYPRGLDADPYNGWSDVERVRQIMVDHGDGDKKIWMTEFGAPTTTQTDGGVSQDEQAREITDVLAKAAQSGFSGPAFIFAIRDVNTADPTDDQNVCGALLTSDWQLKVAAGVLAR
jgi:hypothetical protein